MWCWSRSLDAVLEEREPRRGALLGGGDLAARGGLVRSRSAPRSPRRRERVFGLIVAWVLVRYRFPGRRLVDALVDLPFALPTAVAGIALTTLYAPNGWLGRAARAARHQGRVHAARASRSRSPSSACRSWCARCSRCSRSSIPTSRRRRPAWARAAGRRSGAWCCPTLVPGAAHRLRARLRPGARRVRLGRLHRRQHADEDGDHAAAHHHQARAVRLRGRDGDRGGHARRLLRPAAGHQPAAVLEQQASGPRAEPWPRPLSCTRPRSQAATRATQRARGS